jgi:hypothetical protein
MIRARLIAVVAVLLIASACSSSSSTGTQQPSASPAARPSSPAVLKILKPLNGSSLAAGTVHVEVSLTGAKIVALTSQNLRPDEGHLHLKLDNVVVSMTGGVQADLTDVKPGSHFLEAEFVASDHAPFNPRVFTGITFVAK